MSKAKSLIFICGMPGSGKTTLGKRLATHLSCPFNDLDQVIEDMEGKSVVQIFSDAGEDYFRNCERDALKSFITNSDDETPTAILSLGGGTPCFHNNMELVREHGVVIILDTPLPVVT